MPFGFRKSKKILPGVTFNLTKRGGSVRLGGKGAGYTVGTKGQRVSAGIPGTGVSYSKKLGSPAKAPTNVGSGTSRIVTFTILALIAVGFWWLSH